MSNPNFSPDFSTNQIYVDGDFSVCLTDLLDEMETDIDGKAESGHTHDNYAPNVHTHDGYASANHEHSEYADTTHTHTASQVGYNTLRNGSFTKASGASSLVMEIKYNDYKAALYGTFAVADDVPSGTSVTIATNVTEAVRPNAHYESSMSYFGNRPLIVRLTSAGELQVRNCGASTLAGGSSVTFRISYPIF